MPECQKIKNGGLDQYGAEHFEVYPFDTTGLERVKGNLVFHQVKPVVVCSSAVS